MTGSFEKPRGVLIAGNWKMNHGPAEAGRFFSSLTAQSTNFLTTKALEELKKGRLQVCLIPPALSLAVCHAVCHTAYYERTLEFSGKNLFKIEIAAQNAHWEKSGAFTGELSGPMLKEVGVTSVLIGHSERRQFFGETDESVRKRAESLLEQGFGVILCIGETRIEREAGKTHQVLSRQLEGAIPKREMGAARFLDGRLVVAYEPVWAIGTGITATPEQAHEAHEMIRNLLKERFGHNASEKTKIIYGGSVTPENIKGLLGKKAIDGALVGGASLKAESFLALVKAGAESLSQPPD